jgi:predicted alpha/beta superfamily hydrolase
MKRSEAGVRNCGLDYTIERTTLRSTILGDDIHLSLYTPNVDDANETRDAFIILDGDAFFAYTSATVDYYIKSLKAPPLLIVGVEFEDRKRIFTPTADGAEPSFTRCLREEILPRVEGLGTSIHHKTLIGHSLGGLYALTSMLRGGSLFDAWVAMSPTLTPYVAYMKRLASRMSLQTRGSLFIASDGSTLDESEAARELTETMESRGHKSLRIRRRVYPETDHFTIFVKAFPDVLDFLVPSLAHRHGSD